MVAEERITTKFSGLVGAHGTEEEATFLATQQVDEARHMQFYARFQDEVVAEPATVAAHVERAREQVSDAFRHLFDGALVQAHEALVARPRRPRGEGPLHHALPPVLEGTLGLTTFKFVTDYLTREGLLPGLRRRLLEDPPRRDAPHRLRRLVPAREPSATTPPRPTWSATTLRDLLPSVADVARSRRRRAATPTSTSLGVTADEIRDFALGGLTRRLDIIGVPLSSL